MLTQLQVKQYFEDGYLALNDVLAKDDIEPVKREYASIIEGRAEKLRSEGKLTSTYSELPFERRFARLALEAPPVTEGLDIMQVRSQPLFNFLSNPKLLDLVESIIGPEILCSPVQHCRLVPPKVATSKSVGPAYAWHQDYAVLWPEADGHLIVGIWAPIVDATEENGCLQVIPGSHKLGPLPHRKTTEVETIPDHLPKIEPIRLPVSAGGVVLLNNYMVHRGGANLSDGVRWSFDLRYQHPYAPTGRPFYPSFIVRSRAKPEDVLRDHKEWAARWEFALAAAQGVRTSRW